MNKLGLEAYAKQVGFVEQVPQVQEEEEGFEAYAKRVETMMLQGYHGDATQQREIYYLPPSDMMRWPNQVQEEEEEEEEAGMFCFAGEDGDATGQEQKNTPPFMFLPLLLDYLAM
ncbi:hypothetical protein Bca52824_029152 [Brassica carinata]|uniref:Uncharacterized protein n=1 Tax=Brassica carinata TaxID=52824 RepID=A0A8X7VDN6_BRACI|nr:hypothetical protein Bca52824_029152 [Brassica carinata]